jgi:acyl transferase domain-containing protein
LTAHEPLAIVGMSCLFPRAGSFRAFWANIRNRVDAITPVPPTHWRSEDYLDADPKASDRVYVARGGFLDPVPFPPSEFGIAPNNLEATDSSQLLGLVVAKAALEDAGYESGRIDRNRVAVILGVTGTLELVIPLGARLGHPIWRRALRDAGVADDVAEDVVRRIGENYVGWQENSFPGLLGNVVAGRIANRLDLGGTNCVVDAACASSLSAVHLAALELQTGRADLVLTGGVDTFNDIFMYMCFSKTPALSPTGDARPFDRDGDGTILGEGLGMVVLKRLADAKRDGDRIYAVVKGVGTSSDGKGDAVYAPKASGQVEALRSAYRNADVTPDTIELVEAHGTGTKVGDATELAALTEVFADTPPDGTVGSPCHDGPRRPWCALGSVKSQIGHTKAAAGAAGLLKIAAALHHKVLPPTIKVRQPLDGLRSDSPFYLNTDKRPWMPSANHPRRAALSAFGFGGSNFHCVLEEADSAKSEIDWDDDVQLLSFSADSAEDLDRDLARFPATLDWDELCGRAGDSRHDWRATAAHRLVAVVQRGRTDAGRLLDTARSLVHRSETAVSRSPDGVFYGRGPRDGMLGILFPGQGAQHPGMGRDLVCAFPAAFKALVAADHAFAASGATTRLCDLVYPIQTFDETTCRAHDEALRETRVAQPALGAYGLAAWRVLESSGIRGDAFAGHSYGELTALCAAGRLAEDDFFRLSCLRGRLMSEQAGGAMLAVHAPLDAIRAVLETERLDLTLANRNAPNQTVLSGLVVEIERAAAAFSSRQVRTTRLAVSAGFHSPAIAAAAVPLRAALESVDLRHGLTVYANTTADIYPDDSSAVRDLLAHQLARPVEFVAQIERMHSAGVRTFLEIGPGARLTGLVGQILQGRPHDALSLDASGGLRSAFLDLATALAWLAAHGHDVRLSAWSPLNASARDKPAYTVAIGGANYVKPRPPSTVRPPITPLPRPSAPATNGVATPTMNGQRPDPPPPSAARPAPPAAAFDGAALTQALQVTRDSLAALQRMQEQTAQLHRQFLEGQDGAQRTINLLVEQQKRLLHATLGLPVSAPVAMPAPPAAPIPVPNSRAVAARNETPRSAPPVAPPAPLAATAAPDARHTEAVLIAVISEKTGYPPEMLEPNMALDADLGIDSIKRVEILSVLQDRLPDAPAVKPEHLGTLRTLRDIVAFLNNGSDREGDVPAEPRAVPARQEPRPAEPRPPDVGSPPAANGVDGVESILIDVVSAKTGYPPEMLEPNMTLDADLGIDSIKRVEILSTLQERLPYAPVVKPEHLGTLRTLRDIAVFLANGNGHATNGTPIATATTALERSVPVAVPLDSSRPRDRRLLRPGCDIWLTSDDVELASRVAQRLHELSYQPHLLPFDALADRDCPETLGALILLAPAVVADHHLMNALRGARRTSSTLRRNRGTLLTVSRLDGAFGLTEIDPKREPLDGALAGLAKTAAHEWPEVGCKALDLAAVLPIDDATDAILDELFHAGPVEVGVSRSGCCAVERVVRAASPKSQAPVQPGDVIVVSGGARGVTAEVAVALGTAFRPTLVILGRSPEPAEEPDWLVRLNNEADVKRELAVRANGHGSPRVIAEQYRQILAAREVRNNLARIAATGAKVDYHALDVRDCSAVAAIMAEVQSRLGPVRGLVHGAGVLADARIEDKTDEQFERVYGTKVAGLRHLLTALNEGELRVLVLFSSSTARFGRTGQVDYAMANEVLNKTAQQHARRLSSCRVVAVNWGPWNGGMVTPGLKKLFASEGVGLIPLADGADFLVNEFRSEAGDAEVVVLVTDSSTVPEEPAPPEHPKLSERLPVAFERALEIADHPVLESHVLNGRPVLPVALMVEWLAHAALHQNPGLLFHGIDGLRVLSGVVLDGAAPTIRVGASKATRRDGLFFAPVELCGTRAGRNVVHARADVVLAIDLPPAPTSRESLGLSDYSRSVDDAYQSVLFHGRDLHGIEHVDGYDAAGIRAKVRSAPPPTEWLARPMRHTWLADPLALDCAFQMMILWSAERHGAACLPCFLSRYRQYRRAFPAEGVCISASIMRDSAAMVTADIEFLAGNEVVACLEGYEAVMDPTLQQAFRRNRRPTAVA